MKFICYNGYYKFYPEYKNEQRDISKKILVEQLVPVRDYFTFNSLSNLKRYYLKGDLILDKFKCPKTIETEEDKLENIFLLTGLYYDYNTQSIDYLGSSDSYEGIKESNYLPICGIYHPIIRGRIKNNKVIIE